MTRMFNIKNRPAKVKWIKENLKLVKDAALEASGEFTSFPSVADNAAILVTKAKLDGIFAHSSYWKDVARRIVKLAREERLIV